MPTIFPLILVGVLKKENTAATWYDIPWLELSYVTDLFRSVVGRTLHSSHWPTILRSDSASVRGVRGSIRLIALFEVFFLLLVTIASIVTPLGLYETIVPEDGLKEETFSYAEDNSSMGIGWASPPLAERLVC